jgi:phosphoribosylformylglycinamidine synthase subunit PurL
VTSIHHCSREPVFIQYDSTVRTNTVVHPGGDAAVVRVKRNDGGVEKGIAMCADCNSRYVAIDPCQGTALSVAEAVRNITSVGAVPIGLSDCLNFGNPERPHSMWQLAESVRGLSESCRAFQIPIVSGNVSLYNETKGRPILPTPQLALVGLLDDASKSVTSHFKSSGDRILVIGATFESDLGGSDYLSFQYGIEKGALPKLQYDLEIKTAEVIRSFISERLLSSCHDVSGGGIAVAFAECCFHPRTPLGATVEREDYSGRGDALLFAESGARYIISFSPRYEETIRSALAAARLSISLKGIVGGEWIAIDPIAKLSLPEVYERWRNGLQELFT